MDLRLRVDHQDEGHDILELRVEQAGLVEPPERDRGILGTLGLKRHGGKFRQRESARHVALAAPADLDHVVEHPAIKIRGAGDGHAVADVDLDQALALLVDAIGPGMEHPQADMGVGRRAGAEEQSDLVGSRCAGGKEERGRERERPAMRAHDSAPRIQSITRSASAGAALPRHATCPSGLTRTRRRS